MSYEKIHDIEFEDPADLNSEQLAEYYNFANKVKDRTKGRQYYLHIVEHEDDKEKVEEAEERLSQLKKASRIINELEDEHRRRRIGLDDREHVTARYFEDKEVLLYFDDINMERKLKLKVEAVEKRICDSLAAEILSDDLHGRDVRVRAELIEEDRVLVTAKGESRRAQIEIAGTPV